MRRIFGEKIANFLRRFSGGFGDGQPRDRPEAGPGTLGGYSSALNVTDGGWRTEKKVEFSKEKLHFRTLPNNIQNLAEGRDGTGSGPDRGPTSPNFSLFNKKARSVPIFWGLKSGRILANWRPVGPSFSDLLWNLKKLYVNHFIFWKSDIQTLAPFFYFFIISKFNLKNHSLNTFFVVQCIFDKS